MRTESGVHRLRRVNVELVWRVHANKARASWPSMGWVGTTVRAPGARTSEAWARHEEQENRKEIGRSGARWKWWASGRPVQPWPKRRKGRRVQDGGVRVRGACGACRGHKRSWLDALCWQALVGGTCREKEGASRRGAERASGVAVWSQRVGYTRTWLGLQERSQGAALAYRGRDSWRRGVERKRRTPSGVSLCLIEVRR